MNNIISRVLICLFFVVLARQSIAGKIWNEINYPDWIGVQLIASQLEINGIENQIYQIDSKRSLEKTAIFFESLFEELANNNKLIIDRIDIENAIFVSHFIEPQFVTIQLFKSKFEQKGILTFADFSHINNIWKTLQFPFPIPANLNLTNRLIDRSSLSNSETLSFQSNRSFTNINNQLRIQFLSAQWTEFEFKQQPESNCKISEYHKDGSNIFLTSCGTDTGGTILNIVWEKS